MNRTYSVEEMVEALNDVNASPAVVACVRVDMGGRHLPREKAAKAAQTGATPAMGHFMTHLWEGDVRRAWHRADGRNRSLMKAAGVAPAEGRQ